MVLPMQNRAGFPRMKASILIPRFSVEALSKGLVASYFLPFGTFALERCSIHASPTLLVSSGLETNLSDAPQFLLCQLYQILAVIISTKTLENGRTYFRYYIVVKALCPDPGCYVCAESSLRSPPDHPSSTMSHYYVQSGVAPERSQEWPQLSSP